MNDANSPRVAPERAAGDESAWLPWVIVGGGLLLVLVIAGGLGGMFAFGAGGWGIFALAPILGLALMGLTVYIAFDAKGRGRTGWWIYLICAFISPMQLVCTIAWFAHLRDNPWQLNDSLTM